MDTTRLRIEDHDASHTEARVTKSILDILGKNKLCAISTVMSTSIMPKSTSYINTAYYAFDGFGAVYILTPPQTQHGQNISTNQSVALAVYDSHQVWDVPKQGLQLFGSMERSKGTDLKRGFKLYAERYPPLLRLVSEPDSLEKIDSRFFTFRPSKIKVFDEPTFGTEVWIDCTVL